MLIELVRRAAEQAPDQPVVISSGEVASYGSCLTRSESIANGLLAQGIERFGCALNAPADVLALLAGSSAVGTEGCLYPPDLDADGLGEVASRFDHEVVITDQTTQIDGVRNVTVGELELGEGRQLPHRGDAPVLILTTGTTGDQKGTRHEWSRLINAVRSHDDAAGTRWLLTYNLNQFAGIQMLIHALANRATLVSPPSRTPDDVINTIRSHQVTRVSGTPTFWRLMAGPLEALDNAELPLSQITLGGEATPEGLIERLRTLFPNARISHIFAGSEFGSVISVNDGRSGLPLSALDRDASSDAQLRVIDGELQARSRVGMLGYFRDEDVQDDEWTSTGDLVEIGPDRIHFVGRTSEIINVGGAKIHPLPIEGLVCSVEGVELAAVYGQENPVTGQIVAVDVIAHPGIDEPDLQRRIREKCQELPAAGRPRRIRVVPELEQRGNKLIRHEVQESDE